MPQNSGRRYPGYAQVEYEYTRETFFPSFEWKVMKRPSVRTLPARPIHEARIALVGTAGASVPGQHPHSVGNEGDPTYREIPADAERVRLAHPGYDVPRARRDPDVVFPLALMRRLSSEGVIGELSPRAFSFMGYVPESAPLVGETAPDVAGKLIDDEVDLALLVPA